MKNKKISIITINYNNLEGLKKTVASVINQTWKEFEYIVIDGGSTDGSAAYIESESESIDYWVSERDKGIYNAMNKGIKVATGEYLLFLNSGDILYCKSTIENLIKESFDAMDIIGVDFFMNFNPIVMVEFTEENTFNAGYPVNDIYDIMQNFGYVWYRINNGNLVLETKKMHYPYDNLIAIKEN